MDIDFANQFQLHKTLLRQFKNIVCQVHEKGFVIVASICDEGATNMKSIRHLITDSKRDAFHSGIEPYALCLQNPIIYRICSFTMNSGNNYLL